MMDVHEPTKMYLLPMPEQDLLQAPYELGLHPLFTIRGAIDSLQGGHSVIALIATSIQVLLVVLMCGGKVASLPTSISTRSPGACSPT